MQAILRCNRTEYDFIHPIRMLLDCLPPILRVQLLDTTDSSQNLLLADRPLPRILFPWTKLHYLHLPVRYRLPMHGVYVKKECSLRCCYTRRYRYDNPKLLLLVGDHSRRCPTPSRHSYLHANTHDDVQLC